MTETLLRLDWDRVQATAPAETPGRPAILGPPPGPGLAGLAGERYAELRSLADALDRGAHPADVVVAPLTAPAHVAEPATAACDVLRRALTLVDEWLADDRLRETRLCLLTERAVAASAGEVPDLALAPVQGLVRSLPRDQADRLVLADLDGTEASWRALTGALALAAEEPQLAVRDGCVLVPRLRQVAKEASAAGTPAVDGTVLITAGTTGLGASVARHLAGSGSARHLLLVARPGLDGDPAEAVRAELVELGCEVRIAACDLSDRRALSTLLASIPAEHPLTMVLHAAPAGGDHDLGPLASESVAPLLEPELRAAHLLHELTQDLPLAEFALLSSLAGTVGSPGRAGCAVRGVFLDALAHHRRARGLAGRSLAWGRLDAVRSGESDATAVEVEPALELLDVARGRDEPLLLSVGLDTAALRAAARGGRLPSLLRELARTPTRRGRMLALARAAPEERFEPFPLTDIQRAYMTGRSGVFELGGVAAHLYFEVDCENLHLDRLNTALRRLIERHEMLRAVLSDDGSQRILETVPAYTIEELDLRGEPSDVVADRLASVRDTMSHEVRPADRWPLFGVRASRLTDARTLLHLSFDMLVLDLTSVSILLRELRAVYHDADVDLVPLRLSFRDYVLARAQLERGELYERSRAYWLERARDLPDAPQLPVARPPATLERQRSVRRTDRIDRARWERIRARAAEAGVTPMSALLTAFAHVLAAWSTNQRFLLNVTINDRLPLHPQVDDVLGDFTSVELLEVDLRRPGGLARDAVGLQSRLWQDLRHRHYSGIQLARELIRTRDDGVLVAPVVFTSGIGIELDFPGRPTYGITQTPQVLFDHWLVEDHGDLVLNWDTVDGVFPDPVLDDMFAAYCGFLRAAADDDGLWTGATHHSWLPDHQRDVRARINATAAPVPDARLQDAFFAQARRRPAKTALAWPEGTLSYGELARRAGSLASHLRDLGVRPNTVVGVAVPKGWQQVVAVLGIVAAGGAYMPIDPDLPQERRGQLVERGSLEIVVTSRERPVECAPGIRHVIVEDHLAEHDDVPVAPVQGPDDLAYVIYTSGSTGAPKGIAMTHRAACNTVVDINERFGVGADDSILALSSLSFDLSVYDLFGLLGAGGTVVLPAPGTAREPRHWLALANRYGVNMWNSVPALMELAVAQSAADSRLPAALRLVMLSGDWIPLSLPDRIRALAPDAEVVSLGGATEAGIWSIHHPIGEVDPSWESIPYGTPLRNQFFEVLDEHLEPRPALVPGELFIGGASLARGYWRDEERTRASFFRHPRTGDRLYRTGDMGRYLQDGTIEFLGRRDSQVKIGGYRIELGEIEAALQRHRDVRAAVVAAEGEDRGSRRLVAYVVPRAEADDALLGALREWLAGTLPAYMVPDRLVALGELPLTPTGKVDRKLLRGAAPLATLPDRSQDARGPSGADGLGAGGSAAQPTMLELVLSEVSRVAGDAGPGTIASGATFAELGFDSLRAVELRNRLEAATGLRLPATLIFDFPSPAAVAGRLRELTGGEPAAPRATDEETRIREALASIPISRLRASGLLDALLELANGDGDGDGGDARVGLIDSLDEAGLIEASLAGREAPEHEGGRRHGIA